MPPRSELVLPPRELANCIAGCIFRDTRSVELSDQDRLNYFPASPLFTVTLTLHGQIHYVDKIAPVAELRSQPVLEKRFFQTPRNTPHASWSPGPIVALTVAFFPDAWQRLGGTFEGTPPACVLSALTYLETEPLDTGWRDFCHAMTHIWGDCRATEISGNWMGSSRIKDWAYHLIGQLSQTKTGRSLRSVQRQFQRITGHNRSSLEFFAKVEEVHRLTIVEPDASPAEIAAEAGFADQSHMGRMLKRATGFSPVDLNQKIETQEAFWCYRLLGTRF